MLKFLRRKKVAKRIFYVLAAIIIPAFVLWGSASLIRDKQENRFAGKVFGRNVSFNEYFFTLSAWRNRLKMQFGNNAIYLEKIFNPNRVVWDTIILLHEAQRRKIKVSDSELVNFIASLEFLQKNGTFDQQLYDLFLRYSLNTPAHIFEKQVKQSLMLNKLFEDVTKNISISNEEILDAYRKKNNQIKVNYISVLNEDFKKDISIQDNEIKEYYESHKEDLKKPLQINLIFIGRDYPKDATEEQKKEIDALLQQIKQDLDNKQSISSIESKFNLKFQETGFFSLGEPIPYFGWLEESTDIIFGLENGQFSNVIFTPRGSYIFGLKEKRKDYIPTLEEAKEEIINKLKDNKSKEYAKNAIQDINKKIQAKIAENPQLSLKQICEFVNIPLKETDFFTRESNLSEIGLATEFVTVAFELKPGQISQIIELPNGYFILGDSKLKEFEQKKFEEEKEAFKNELLIQKKNKAFEEFVNNLRTQANLVDYVGQQKQN